MSDPLQRGGGDQPRGWVLVGPTASGKTDVAHRIARRQGWGIVSADSMLVYRGLDIGTAKPTARERRGIPYAGIDLVEPSQPCSAGLFLERVGREVRRADGPADWIVTGGTGLYVKCLMEGLDAPAPGDPGARREAEAAFEAGGVSALQDLLSRSAPEALARLADPMNPRRLVRAYEVARAGGGAPGRHRNAAVIVGLRPDRAEHERRMVRRVGRMFAEGLVEEVRSILASGVALSVTARHAIGYQEALDVLSGACTEAQALVRTAIRTRQYAKRQMTWFRHQADVDWVEVGPGADPDDVAREVEARWEQHGSARLVV